MPKPLALPQLFLVRLYDVGTDGELRGARPTSFPTAEAAIRAAETAAAEHAGALAWSWEVDPDLGEYGPPQILFRAGKAPDQIG